jgi:predicted ATPase
VKGIAEPVLAFEVLEERQSLSRFDAIRRSQRTNFVGRGQEVGLLLDRWEQAKSGDGQLALLSGEAGIGKSRITETMVQQVLVEPHHRIRYQCTPQHTNSPLYPAIAQLSNAAGIQPEDDSASRTAKIKGAMPDVADEQVALVASLLGAPIPKESPLANLTPALRRQLTLDAFIVQLEALCRQHPVQWLVEDAHWIDPTTEELITRIVERAGTQRLLIVVTHRPTYIPLWSSAPIATQVTLNRLSRTHAGALLEGLGGGKRLPPEALEYILDRTDGVPLYMEELFQALRDSSALRETETAFELSRSLEGTAVPTTLQDSLMARLDRLAPAKSVAQLGAAIGREFEYELLSAVTDMSPTALSEGLTSSWLPV